MTSRRWTLAAALAFAALAAGALGVAWVEQRAGSQGKGVAAIGGPFSLVDDRGAPVSEASLLGKPSVIYFGYTFCPEVCPTTLNDLARWIRAQGSEADRMNYVFITVDPERDNAQLMHDYVTSFDPHLRGFTGTPEQIAAAAKAWRVYYRKIPISNGSYEMDHSAMLYLMGPDGKFVDLIAYGESDASALAKLKNLAAGRSTR